MTAGRILVVDDEPGVRSSLSAILTDEGFEVETVESGEECLVVVGQEPFQAIFLDVWLPGCDGLETLKSMRRTGVDAAVIMISGHATIETAVRATKMGAHDFVEKPLSLEKVVLTLRNALRARKLEQRNRILREELRRDIQVIGESAAIRRLRGTIETAAPTGAGVLISGENGVGKELAARLVHARSPRAEEAFIEVACASVPPERMLEELFGRAIAPQQQVTRGKVELAHEGTLFLDDVDALSEEAQGHLLRALESGRFMPVNCHTEVVADARPVAATEKDLAAEVAAGRFRADLHSKLNVVPLEIPPLRERAEDVPLLVEHYLARYAREYGRPPKSVEPAAMEALAHYAWPGNVRELRNVVERLAILAPGRSVVPDDLPFKAGAGAPAGPRAADGQPTLQEERAAFERRLILERLERFEWNVSKTADSLGIERSNLYRKMKALEIRSTEL